MLVLLLILAGASSMGASGSSESCKGRADVTVADITLADDASPGTAKRIFQEHGVLVVRGLNAALAPRISRAADRAFARSVEQLEAGNIEPVQNGDHIIGWVTPDQTLFIPAPEGHVRKLQAMVLALDYFQDAVMLQAATSERTLDVLEEMTDWQSIELFGKGQCFYKEGVTNATSAGGVSVRMMGAAAKADTSVADELTPGGSPKYLHQDSVCRLLAQTLDLPQPALIVCSSHALDRPTSCLRTRARSPRSRTRSTRAARSTTGRSMWCQAHIGWAISRIGTRHRILPSLATSGASTMRCASMG